MVKFWLKKSSENVGTAKLLDWQSQSYCGPFFFCSTQGSRRLEQVQNKTANELSAEPDLRKKFPAAEMSRE